MCVETLQALLETAELRANLAEGKVEALRMKVETSLEVIENLRDQIVLLEAELEDVRELVPVDGVECEQHGTSGCCHVECLAKEQDFLNEMVAERTAINKGFPSMVARAATQRELEEYLRKLDWHSTDITVTAADPLCTCQSEKLGEPVYYRTHDTEE